MRVHLRGRSLKRCKRGASEVGTEDNSGLRGEKCIFACFWWPLQPFDPFCLSHTLQTTLPSRMLLQSVLNTISAENFAIIRQRTLRWSRDDAREFYKEHEGGSIGPVLPSVSRCGHVPPNEVQKNMRSTNCRQPHVRCLLAAFVIVPWVCGERFCGAPVQGSPVQGSTLHFF